MTPRYDRQLSYESQKAIWKHLSFGPRSLLARYNRSMDRVLPYQVGLLETEIDATYKAFRIKVKYNKNPKDIRYMIWSFIEDELYIAIQEERERSVHIVNFVSYEIKEGVLLFHKALDFFFGRKGTRVVEWQIMGGIPQIKLSNVINIGKLVFDQSLYSDFYVPSLVFLESYDKVGEMMLIGEEQNSQGPAPAFALLAAGKTLKVDIEGVYDRERKIVQLIDVIIEKCHTIGFKCVVNTGGVWFEELYRELQSGINRTWVIKWYHSRICATFERENDEVNVFSNFEPERHTICIRISERGFAQMTNFSPNRQLTENSLSMIIRNFPWSLRRDLYMDKARFCNLTIIPMDLDTFHMTPDKTLVDGYEENEFVATHLGNQGIHINTLIVEEENSVPLRSWTFDNLTILSKKPFSLSFNGILVPGRTLNTLKATSDATLENLGELRKKAEKVEFIGEPSYLSRFYDWVASFFF